jgi:hypothetical protein
MSNSTDITISEAEAEAFDKYWVTIHGATMTFAWCLFIPLGIIMSRHKWIFQDRVFLGLHIWFHLHRLIQILGMGLFITSFAIVSLELAIPDGSVGFAHYCIGYTIIAATGGMVVTVFLRPLNSDVYRWVWNFVHHNLGRLTTLLAWINVYIGIYCMHKQINEPYVRWIVPITITLITILGIDIILEPIRYKKIQDIIHKKEIEKRTELEEEKKTEEARASTQSELIP